MEKLTKLMRGLSIRQLTAAIKQDELKLVQLLSPYVEQGVFYLRDPQPPFDRLPKIPKLRPNTPLLQRQDSAKTYKVVCIDDSPTILEEIKYFLGEDRYQVTAIDSPTESLTLLFEIKPDLVLMDITMPDINGYQLCNLLRKSAPAFEKIPIIMVTGNRGFIDRAKAKLSGATDYLTKPFSREALLGVIGKYLQP
ncbi:MAG: response regulator [Chloroflexaceae bacterium]|nr:response regulator [Chloroflexaceae bacterium]